jgi:hypothetical protein
VSNPNAMNFMLQLPDYATMDLRDKFPSHKDNVPAIALLKALLVVDPRKRLDAKGALEHKYVEEFREVRRNNFMLPVRSVRVTKTSAHRRSARWRLCDP